jgi:hypothetical protein
LPRRGDGDVVFDAGTVKLTAAPRLRVATTEGEPRTAAGLGRVGLHDVREPEPTFALDARGGWLGPDPRAGDAIVVPPSPRELEPVAEREGLAIFDVPARTVLRGEGPWTVTVPAGQVLLEVRDARGELLVGSARVFVRDYAFVAGARALLRQLPAGLLVLHVAAEGHEACAVHVQVPARGIAAAKVALRRR